MDHRGANQDPFFGDLDELDSVMSTDANSRRTLVADSTGPTGPEHPAVRHGVSTSQQAPQRSWRDEVLSPALRDHFDERERDFVRAVDGTSTVQPFRQPTFSAVPLFSPSPSWRHRRRSSQQTLVPLDQSDSIDVLPSRPSYGNPQPTYFDETIYNSESQGPGRRRLFQVARPAAVQPVRREPSDDDNDDDDDKEHNDDDDDKKYNDDDDDKKYNHSFHHFLGQVKGTKSQDYMSDAEAQAFADSTAPTVSTEDESSENAYQLAPDKAMLHTAMSFVDFLPHHPLQPARLVVVTQDDGTFDVEGLDLAYLEKKCALLAMGFERNRAGVVKNSLEARSRIIAISFLRHLYTGSYLVTADDDVSLIAPSLLFHTEMYQMGEIFDLPDLKKEARANVTRVSEFADCYPTPPEDLCEAARFVYSQLAKHTSLIEIIQHYCVNCFRRHSLKDNLPFCKLVVEVPLFGLDLLKTNIERGFKDDGAADIIQLPINTAPRTDQLKAEQLALVDFIYDIWGPQTFATRCGDDSTASSTPSSSRLSGYALVRRPKVTVVSDDSDATASENEGFTLVHRPRLLKRRDVSDSADEADISDWSDAVGSDIEDMSPRRRGKLPKRSLVGDMAMSSSVATVRPPPRSRTPTQANPDPSSDEPFDSSDADFAVLKPNGQSMKHVDDSDEFELV